jgi:alpha,alpha-trehalase
MAEPSLDVHTGLSRYRPAGQGIPPETEPDHFHHLIRPYAQKLGISIPKYIKGYNKKTILEPELDEFFMHDRGIRESGHDTSYRLEGRCADIATVDLNSLLYKYESDIATAIEQVFDDELELEDEFTLAPWPISAETYAQDAVKQQSTSKKQTSAEWKARMAKRRTKMTELCWNEGKGMYFDYNCRTGKQSLYESVTTLYPLWAGCASRPKLSPWSRRRCQSSR